MNLGFIEPIVLTAEEEKHYTEEAARVNKVMSALSESLYGEGEIHLNQLRKDLATGVIEHLTPMEFEAFETLGKLTDVWLKSHVLCAAKLARSFFRAKLCPTLSYDDYFQEAVIKISDCAFSFNGSVKFITYLTKAIHNRLLAMTREDSYSSTPSQEIVANLSNIWEVMNKQDLSFEDAAKNLGLSDRDAFGARQAGRTTSLFSQTKQEDKNGRSRSLEDTLADTHTDSIIIEADELWSAVKAADLSDFEAAVFDAYLTSSDDRFRSDVAVRFGKTRAAAGLAFKRAKDKIKLAYENRHPSKLAA